jgi:branched-chain amino acid transport system substrate-binding protein
MNRVRDGIVGKLGCAVLVTILSGGLAACGDGSDDVASPGSGGGLPDTVKILSATPLTGAPAFAGQSQLEGVQLAVDEINETGYLGSTKIEVQSEDTAATAQTAASLVSTAVGDDSISAVVGSVLGSDAVAQSAIAQAQGLPIVYTEAGAEGVVVGDYTYRASPAFADSLPKALEYAKSNGMAKVGVLYLESQPTYQDAVSKDIPGYEDEFGFEMTATAGVSATTTDFSAPVSRILQDDPDTVIVLLVGAPNASAVTQLRQQGFDGTVIAQPGAGAGNLTPAGDDAKNVIWATGYSPDSAKPGSVAFTELYESKNDGEAPLIYAADGYDAMWFIARAIKAADSADRDAIKDGLAEVGAQGWDAAQGAVTFEDNKLQTDGVLIAWDPAKQQETLLKD